jgi:hypothetical protein
MEILRESGLREYVCQFWRRERTKINSKNIVAFAALDSGIDSIELLFQTYADKLPDAVKSYNGTTWNASRAVFQIVLLNRDEVGALVIHDRLIIPFEAGNDNWFTRPGHGFGVNPEKTGILGNEEKL